MKKTFLLTASAFGFLSICHAQSLSPNVLSPAGGIDKTNTMQVEWTLGESAIETIACGDKVYTEGFHQSTLRVVGVESVNDALNSSYNIVVAPNPVASVLTVNIQSKEDSEVYFTLTDINGKKISATQGVSAGSKDIDMTGLASALYILHVYNGSGSLIKSFKISKIQ